MMLKGYAGRKHAFETHAVTLSVPGMTAISQLGGSIDISSRPIFMAAASLDVFYQLTDNMNALVQQQLSGRRHLLTEATCHTS